MSIFYMYYSNRVIFHLLPILIYYLATFTLSYREVRTPVDKLLDHMCTLNVYPTTSDSRT